MSNPDTHVAICVVVVTFNSAHDLAGLVASLDAAVGDYSYSVIVVDNCSTDGTSEVAAQLGTQCIQLGTNLGYAAGVNIGRAEGASAEAILITNPDIRFYPGSVSRLFDVATRNGTVCVPRIVDESGRTLRSLRREPSLRGQLGEAFLGDHFASRPSVWSIILRDPADYLSSHATDWATGAVLLVPTGCDRAIGPWSEEFFLYSEEVDYFRRVREAGLVPTFVPEATVFHSEGGSGRTPALVGLEAVNRLRYFRQQHGPLAAYVYAALVLAEKVLRSGDPVQRRAACAVLSHMGPSLLTGRMQPGIQMVGRI